MSAPLDYKQTVSVLGNGIFVAPTLDGEGIQPDILSLVGLYAGPGAVAYSVSVADKYSCPGGDVTASPCPPSVTAQPTICKRVPPYNDMIPAPSTVFAQQSVFDSLGAQTHSSLDAAKNRISAATTPTGFWLLTTTDGNYVTIEVGIQPENGSS